MTTFEEQLKKNAQTISLSTDERESIRSYLAEYRAYVPLRAEQRTLERQRTATARTKAFIFDIVKLARARTLVWSIVGVLLMTTSGMAYAAEGAVPGDSLYGLKINVNEEIVRAFSFGDDARAMWEARRAERRLEEASQLASAGALTPERERQVAEQFERHIERVAERTSEIKEDDPVRASDMNEMLENAFSAHEAILVSIAIEEQLSAESVKKLAGTVRSVAQEFGRVQSQTEEVLTVAGEVADDGDTEQSIVASGFDTTLNEYDQRILVQRMREGAERSLKTAESRVTRMSLIGSRDISTSKTRLNDIRRVYELAREDYNAGNMELAYARYKAVRSVADRLARFLDAQRDLDIDALSLDLAEELLFATGTTSDGVSKTASLVLKTLDEQKATIEESISAFSLTDVLDELSPKNRAEVERLLKRARALVVRATLAQETDDGDEASHFYASAQEALEQVRTILLSPQPIESYDNDYTDLNAQDGETLDALNTGTSSENEEHLTMETATDTPVLSVAHGYAEGTHTFAGIFSEGVCVQGADLSRAEEENAFVLTIQTTHDASLCGGTAPERAFSVTRIGGEGDTLMRVIVNGKDTPFVFIGISEDGVVESKQRSSSSSTDGIEVTDLEASSSATSAIPTKGYRATNGLMNRVLNDLWKVLE